MTDRLENGKSEYDIISRARLVRLATILNIVALPVYVLIGTMFAGQLSVAWSWRHGVGSGAGLLMMVLALSAWRWNPRLGAIIQLVFLLPVVVAAFYLTRANWSSWEVGAFRDWRVLVGLIVAVAMPSAVIALSVIALMRSRCQE